MSTIFNQNHNIAFLNKLHPVVSKSGLLSRMYHDLDNVVIFLTTSSYPIMSLIQLRLITAVTYS